MKKTILLSLIALNAMVANAQWTQTSFDSTSVISLAISNTNIFAGNKHGNVYFSSNKGSSWTKVVNGFNGNSFEVPALIINGSDIFAGTWFGVYLSSNNGSNWVNKDYGLPSNSPHGYPYITSFAISGSNLFAGRNDNGGGGVYLTSNNGGSWATTSLTNGVNALAISGSNIYAGSNGTGVYWSSNNGSSWSAIGPTSTDIRAFATSGDTILAGTYGGGMYRTTNPGVGCTWTAVNTGLTNLYVYALAKSGNNIFAGTGGGVFFSSNNGGSWSAWNIGLTDLIVYSLAIGGDSVFAGTYDWGSNPGGVWVNNASFFTVTTMQTNVSCYGDNNGTAIAYATGGGISPFTYLWSTTPAQTTQISTGLVAGNYSVTVTAANGISSTESVTITQPSLILINNPQTICSGNSYVINGHTYTVAGTYHDTLAAVNGCDSIINTQLTVNTTPQTPTITQFGGSLISSASSGNQWYNDSGIITSATSQTYAPTSTSHYYCIVTAANGCESDTSNVIYVVITGLNELSDNKNIYIYPNPVTDNIFIEAQQKATIEILNIQGQLIKTIAANSNKTNVDISALPSGVYIIEVKTEKGIAVKKFIKE